MSRRGNIAAGRARERVRRALAELAELVADTTPGTVLEDAWRHEIEERRHAERIARARRDRGQVSA